MIGLLPPILIFLVLRSLLIQLPISHAIQLLVIGRLPQMLTQRPVKMLARHLTQHLCQIWVKITEVNFLSQQHKLLVLPTRMMRRMVAKSRQILEMHQRIQMIQQKLVGHVRIKITRLMK
jgi:hypothetical protein